MGVIALQNSWQAIVNNPGSQCGREFSLINAMGKFILLAFFLAKKFRKPLLKIFSSLTALK